ncbi:non-specific serine/threonine protein kinase [Trifolium repens]|nr:non-specific serine/threonine protein kinase [Trifolium repens]
MAMLPSIAEVDLSENSLIGGVPSNFSITLEYFNISFNSLTGPIPSSGLFKILDPSSYAGNENLCGSLLAKPCISAGENEPEARHQQPKKITVAIVCIIVAASGIIEVFVTVAVFRFIKARNKTYGKVAQWKLTVFQQLNFTAEDVLKCV